MMERISSQGRPGNPPALLPDLPVSVGLTVALRSALMVRLS